MVVKSAEHLCLLLIREYFGEVNARVVHTLLSLGVGSLFHIVSQSKLPSKLVKRAIANLIQHNFVTFTQNSSNTVVLYRVDVESVICIKRYARFIYCMKELYGDECELIIEELFINGKVTASAVIEKVTKRLCEAYEDSKKVDFTAVERKFDLLSKLGYISSVHGLQIKDDVILPDEETHEDKRLKIDEISSSSILWTVNINKFNHLYRKRVISDYFKRKLDENAGLIIEAILEVVGNKSVEKHLSSPVTAREICDFLSKNATFKAEFLENYLCVLTSDKFDCLHRVGDEGFGCYVFDFKKAAKSLLKCHLDCYIREKYGSKVLRLLNVIIDCGKVQLKQLEEKALLDPKSVKPMLNSLLNEKFVFVAEFSHSGDMTAQKSQHFFYFDFIQAAKSLLHNSYKSMVNLITKRNSLMRENLALIDKHSRIEALVAFLKKENADVEQIMEVQNSLSEGERKAVEDYKYKIEKLESAEVQLDEALLAIESINEFI